MKVPLSWLREFVDVPASGEEIGAVMSLRGFALEGIEPTADGDQVLDFDITANRPDCMNVVGMAREIATAYDRPLLHAPGLAPELPMHASELRITLEVPELCPSYAGALVDVTIGPSPDWMQARLKACGIRPISNIVDVTNYVLLELGQPMHAFDYARLGGHEIRVRTAREGERLRTLDGQDRVLTSDMLVIADASTPVAVAGVMGGADSEVTTATTTIVLESAYFAPRAVRRTSRQLGLKTEASMRFERGADRMMPAAGLLRACALLEEIGAGTRRQLLLAGHAENVAPRVLALRRARLAALLGTDVPDADVVRLLGGLGFMLEDTADGWAVTVPLRRIDVLREIDLIEEVARHYGFDRLPVRFPSLLAAPPRIDPRITRARHLRAALTGAGVSEAVTFGFVSAIAAAPFAAEGDLVPIANPLSENFSVLRPSALPGLLDAVAHNRRRERRDIRLFEIGNRFTRAGGERRALACAWTGSAVAAHWSGAAREVDFFDMKGLVERIADVLDLDVRVEAVREPWLVPGRAAAIVCGETRLGVLGQLAPDIAARHGAPAQDAIYVAEIDLDVADRLAPSAPLAVRALPRFPSVTRDISVLVADTLTVAVIRATVRDAAPDELVTITEFDRYQGTGVPDGQVSLSFRLTFRSPERTLTDAEIQAAMEAVLDALRTRHAAVQR